MPVSTDDHIAITDLLGRYCWTVDEGDEEGWSMLWTEGGIFSGATPEPVVGREALKTVPRTVRDGFKGRLRHLTGNLHCDYVDGDTDRIRARYYNFVTTWLSGGALQCMALSTLLLVRTEGGWLIDRNDTVNLT
jgi:hypothetical protein